MSKKSRAAAMLLAIAVLFVMLFSACYIAAESDHDCTGEDCPICWQISLCESTLKSFGLALLLVIFAAFIGFFTLSLPSLRDRSAVQPTLVSLKVKLSD